MAYILGCLCIPEGSQELTDVRNYDPPSYYNEKRGLVKNILQKKRETKPPSINLAG